jgi:uncharacterized protein YuzE
MELSLDYNAAVKVVGIEVLHLSQRSPSALEKILLETS